MADDLQSFHGMPSLFVLLAMKLSPLLYQVLGWSVFVRVDGLSYSFLGDEGLVPGGPLNGSVNFTNIVVTPTQTVIVAQAGPMQVNLTFLNPIEVRFHPSDTFNILHIYHLKPGDWVKQSIPFTYMAFTAESSDGASHAVQVYSDVSGGTCNRSAKLVDSLQLRCRVVHGGSKSRDPVEHDVQFRCDLPQCQRRHTNIVQRDLPTSDMGYTILWDADRE
jgi:hypothetical protein